MYHHMTITDRQLVQYLMTPCVSCAQPGNLVTVDQCIQGQFSHQIPLLYVHVLCVHVLTVAVTEVSALRSSLISALYLCLRVALLAR